MKLAVIGGGYVGLVTAVVFAELGHEVKVIETDLQKLAKLQAGEVPFFEPGVPELLSKHFGKSLFFSSDYQEVIPEAEVIFICVGTPTKNGRADLSYVYSAVGSIAEKLTNPAIIVVKSTVPPGTNEKLAIKMKRLTRVGFDLASVPEFLREGKALWDTHHPYRVVIGAENKKVIKKLKELHRKIPGKRLVCSPESAQLIKYASNAFLPTKISFANSIAVLCDHFRANVDDVLAGVGMDKRIGKDFLGAGLGYGGSCFPKDVAALIQIAHQKSYNFELLKATEKTNRKQIDYFINKVENLCHGEVKDKIFVVLGLAFKPGTSDMREARSIYVIKKLLEKGAKVRACDPVAILEAQKIIAGVDFLSDPYEALAGADCLLLVTEWPEYQKLDFAKIKKIMRSWIVVDGRNIYNRKQLEKLGFIYGGIGK